MTKRIARLNAARELIVMTATLLAVPGVALIALMNGPGLRAQSLTESLGKPSGPKFEVASIKRAPDLQAALTPHVGINIDAARVDIGYWSIKQLVMRAYGLWPYQLSGPDWMDSLRFDVMAKVPEGTNQNQVSWMLQWLLAERFRLVAHGETKALPALALVVGKGGPKMKAAPRDAEILPVSSKDDDDSNRIIRVGRMLDSLWGSETGPKGPFGLTKIAYNNGVLHMDVAQMPMEALAQILASYLRGPVIDMTGLQGEYQVSLEFSIGTALDGAATPTESETLTTSVVSAMQRLGLRLERRKLPMAVLVVDHVERVPTAN